MMGGGAAERAQPRSLSKHERVGTEPSPIQTVTVGPGVSPDLRIAPLAGYTAGGDFHPAPKVSRA
jgi:hypothetical protein